LIQNSLWQQFDVGLRRAIPTLLTLLLLFVGVLPWHIHGLSSISAGFVLISVYFWTLHQPTLMNMWLVAAIGVAGDILGTAPLGVGTVVLLTAYGLTNAQRKILTGAPFVLLWGGFLLIAAITTILQWLLSSLVEETFIDPQPALFLCVVTVVCYPPLSYFFTGVQRRLLRV
jgi:rod shape-determining protein MreD